MSIDPIRRHLATVAEDHTIRVWDVDTMQQVYTSPVVVTKLPPGFTGNLT